MEKRLWAKWMSFIYFCAHSKVQKVAVAEVEVCTHCKRGPNSSEVKNTTIDGLWDTRSFVVPVMPVIQRHMRELDRTGIEIKQG